MKKVALVSLGCAKNLVDSEVMLAVLKRSGYRPVADEAGADVIIVNTCGFIEPARQEARQAIERALAAKAADPAKKVVVAGCYVRREGPELRAEYPGVDVWTGVSDFDRVDRLVRGEKFTSRSSTFLYDDRTPRLVSTPASWAYVKISEGCSHRCSFCAIPSIKGPYRSRATASVVREARALASLGVKELNLISHDTTFYGSDRGVRHGLVRLLEKVTAVPGIAWVRVLYGHPEEISDELLAAMTDPKVCRYLDIPFQHCDPALVRSMGRRLDGPRALRLLERIRARLPEAAVRTSLIVGYPGEGRREFEALLEFVRQARFDHLGVFSYSPEKGTRAGSLQDPLSLSEKEERRRAVMELQASISAERNRGYVGRRLEVLIEAGPDGRGHDYSGRTRFQAPEVDGTTGLKLPRAAKAPVSPLVEAEITRSGTYNLEGRIVG
jgi:ribosomal protein S12 methylthiotransferase